MKDQGHIEKVLLCLMTMCICCAGSSGANAGAADDGSVEVMRKSERESSPMPKRIPGPGLKWKMGFEDNACIQISQGGKCHVSMAEILKTDSNLAARLRRDPIAMLEFAQALHWLEESNHNRKNAQHVMESILVIDAEIAADTVKSWIDREFTLDLDRWRASVSMMAPDLTQISAPRWQGSTFVSDALLWRQTDTIPHVVGLRYQVDFDKGTVSFHEVSQHPVPLEGRKARVYEQFGGAIDAFVGLSISDDIRLLVAVGAKKGASPYVLLRESKAVGRYASWRELSVEIPSQERARVLAELTTRLSLVLSSGEHVVIRDAAAYRVKYKEEKWDTLRLRYWHDQLRVTLYSIPEFGSIADPIVTNERLVVYCMERHNTGREPYRLDLDLSTLSMRSRFKKTELATATIISDTQSGSLTPVDSP